jgi:endonuclease/exonuclease/phosphatase family metal-dependent hydrolase
MKKLTIFLLVLAMLLALPTFAGCKDPATEQPDNNGNENPGQTETPENPENPEEPEEPEEPKDPADTQDKEPEEPEVLKLRIGSYNIANGSRVSHNIKKIAEDIRALDLDIVGLQEIDRHASRSQYLDTMKRLSDLTGYKYYYFSKAINIGGDVDRFGHEGEYGTGILSKYPITFEETTQLASGGYEQRVLGHVIIQVEDAEVHFFNAHLTYNTLDVRKTQMEAIEEMVYEYDYCLLTGDFNVRDLSEFETIESLTGVSNEDNPLLSYHEWKEDPWPTGCIDNIMYSSSFILLDSGVQDDRKNSDHHLIWAEFEVK